MCVPCATPMPRLLAGTRAQERARLTLHLMTRQCSVISLSPSRRLSTPCACGDGRGARVTSAPNQQGRELEEALLRPRQWCRALARKSDTTLTREMTNWHTTVAVLTHVPSLALQLTVCVAGGDVSVPLRLSSGNGSLGACAPLPPVLSNDTCQHRGGRVFPRDQALMSQTWHFS